MNLFAISGLSVAISCAVLSLITLLFSKSRLHRLLLNFNLVVAVWGLGVFLVGIAESGQKALTAWKIAHLGSIFIGPMFYHLVSVFCEKMHRKTLFGLYLVSLLYFAGFIWTDLIINKVQYVSGLYFSVATPAYVGAMAGTYIFPISLSYLELCRMLRRTRGHKLLQTQYIMNSFMFGFVGGGTTFLPMFGLNLFYPVGNFGITIYASVLTYAILKHRLMDIQLIFRRTMIYSISLGLLSALFLLLIIIMSSYISGFTGHTSLWVSSIAALIIAVLFTPLKNRVQMLIDKVFYKTRYDYYSTIQKAGSDLVTLIRQSDIRSYIIGLIRDTLKVKNARFYLLDEESFKSEGAACSNNGASNEEVTKKLEGNADLIRHLEAGSGIIIQEDMSAAISEGSAQAVRDLRPFEGKIAVPFLVEGRLESILIMGEKLSGDVYTDEDINLLRTISSQAAISLKNAKLYEELEKKVDDRTAELSMANKKLRNEIKERIKSEKELKRFAYELERSNRELEDFTKIVSHDLQEPLWKVKLFGDRLKAEYSDGLGKKGEECMDIMYRSITRMQQLINDLLALSCVTIRAQPNSSVDLNSVVGEVLVDLEMRIEEVKARVEIDTLPVIEADPSQMRQLFQNLIGNALKFHSESRSPVIKISSRITEADSMKVDLDCSVSKLCTVWVEDNGIGFDEAYLDYIFGVFQRLHGREEYHGTGMGLAICRKIIERHGGNITATSREGEGSIFIVNLPVSQPYTENAEITSDIFIKNPAAPSELSD